MADLRNFQLPALQPRMDVSAQADPGAAMAVRGLAQAESTFDMLGRQSAMQARYAQEQADKSALGGLVAQAAEDEVSFLVEGIEQSDATRASQLAKEVAESGGHVGDTGLPVLESAARISRGIKLAQEQGNLTMANRLRFLVGQHGLIQQRPDLVQEIVSVTNANAADTNTILAKQQDNAYQAAVEATQHQRNIEDEALKARGFSTDPRDPNRSKNLLWTQTNTQRMLEAKEYVDNEKASLDLELSKINLDKAKVEQAKQRAWLTIQDTMPRYAASANATIADLSETARNMPNADGPAKAQWFRQQVDALVAEQADQGLRHWPEEASRLRTALYSQADRYADYVSGKAMTDDAKDQLAGLQAQNEMDYERAHPNFKIDLNVLTASTAALREVAGEKKSREALVEAWVPLLNLAGQDRSSRTLLGLPEPKAGAERPLDYGSTSPFTRGKLQPGQVTRPMKDRTIEQLSWIVQAQAKRPMAWSSKMASTAIVAGFTDPAVQGDPVSINAMTDWISSSPQVAPLFQGAGGNEARQAAFPAINSFFTGAIDTIEGKTGVTLNRAVHVTVDPVGNVMLTPLPGAGGAVPGNVMSKLSRDMSMAVRAVAHLSGRTDYAVVGQSMFGFAAKPQE